MIVVTTTNPARRVANILVMMTTTIKPHQYTDPDKLPLRTPDGKVRKPYETKEQYQASLFPPKYDQVMLAGPIPDGLQLTQATLPQDPQDTVTWSFPEVFRPTVCYT
jgi:hypothetical protein